MGRVAPICERRAKSFGPEGLYEFPCCAGRENRIPSVRLSPHGGRTRSMRTPTRVSLTLGALLLAGLSSPASSGPAPASRSASLVASAVERGTSRSLPAPSPARRARSHAATAPRLSARPRASSSRSRATLPLAAMPAAVNLAPASIASAADATPLSHSQRLGIWRSAGRGPPRASPAHASFESVRIRSTRWESLATPSRPTRRTQPAAQFLLAGSIAGFAPNFPELPYACSRAGNPEGMTARSIPPSGGRS